MKFGTTSPTAILASAAGASDNKPSVRLATIAALPAVTATAQTLTANAVGALSVDGVAVALNDRILVKNQVATANNGIYYVSTLGTAGVAFVLTRTDDANTWAELPAATVAVESTAGSSIGGTGWMFAIAAGGTLGSTAIAFIQVFGVVSDVAYNATTWDGVTTIAPSKNAVRDEVEVLLAAIAALTTPVVENVSNFTATSGSQHIVTPTTSVTVTLPVVAAGSRVKVTNNSTKLVQIVRAASDNIGDGTATTYNVPAYATVELGYASAARWGFFSYPDADIGTVRQFTGSSFPVGWGPADGVELNRVSYGGLFAVQGTTFGVGNATTTFNPIDATGRVMAGKEAVATRLTPGGCGIDGATLGAAGGEQTHVLSEAELPAHLHILDEVATATADFVSTAGDTSALIPAGAGSTGATGSNTAHPNVQPTIVVLFGVRY